MIGVIGPSEVDISAMSRTTDRLDEPVLQMFALVRDAVSSATEIFLAGDREAARSLVQRDQLIDSLHNKTEKAVVEELTRQPQTDPGRQNRLLLILRILPELERSGDLAEHIASHAVQGLSKWLTPRARTLIQQMGALGSEMWGVAGEAYATGDASGADLLRVRDDEIDDLHVSLTSELAAAGVSVPVAIEMALVARYFERLGDHAVNVTRRIQQTVMES
jgi:phosphate transport system protein